MVVRSKEIFMDSSQWQQRLMQMDRGLKVAEHQNRMATSCAQPLLEQRSTMKISTPPIQQQHTDSQDPSQNNNTSTNNNNQEALKCPRCDSTNTKFCYYNNYSLSQPRHFCKTCRRYWTRGGALRNVPVGGGCRKNKRSKRALSGLDHLHAASIMASNNPAGLSMSLPMSNMTSDLLSNPFNPNSSFLYGLPSTCNNDINMAFARIQQLGLKNNGEYNLSHGLNSDIHIQGLEYCPSRPSNEDMSSYGMTPNTAINIYEGLDSSVNDASMPWSGSSGSLHHHHMSKVTAPLLQTHSLVGSFENGEQKPKVKVEEDCRSLMGSQWQMTPASNTVDTHAYQSSENNGANSTSEYWNGANGWPDLPSYGSSGPSSSVV